MFKFSVQILFLAVIIISSSCSAQSKLTLQISVLDKDNVGIPQAEINLSRSGTSIIRKTDLNGSLEFKGLKKGRYILAISALGYYRLDNFPITFDKKNEQLKVEMQPVDNLMEPNVKWEGGWVTFEDKQGNIKSIRINKNK